MPRQIVFILSTNFAGSHFLALQLGSHPACESIGEIHHVQRPAHRRRPLCSRCPSDEACPIYRGVNEAPRPRIFDRVFENIEAFRPGVGTAIDNSKKTRWAGQFLHLKDSKDFTLKFIHLIRDPRGLIRRWMMNYDTAREKRKVRLLTARRCWRSLFSILRGSEANVYLWKWLYQNRLITDFIGRNKLDGRLMTYEELALNPDRELGALMPWLGLDYQPAQKEYWKVEHHGTFKDQYMKPPRDGENYLDQRWKSYLDAASQREALAHQGIADYLAELGLALDEQTGLKQRGGHPQAAH